MKSLLLPIALLLLLPLQYADAGKKKKKKGPAKVNVRAETNTPETLELFVAIEERASTAEIASKIEAGGDLGALFESSPSCERIKCMPLHVAAATAQPEAVAVLAEQGAALAGLDGTLVTAAMENGAAAAAGRESQRAGDSIAACPAV